MTKALFVHELTAPTVLPFGAPTSYMQNGQVDEDVEGIGLHKVHKLYLEIKINNTARAPLHLYHST